MSCNFYVTQRYMIHIIGNGGHSRVVQSILNKQYKGFQVHENHMEFIHTGIDNVSVVIAVGNNRSRKKIKESLSHIELVFPNVISEHAVISDDVDLGQGNVICTGAVIESGCTIGDFNIINTNSSINHDSVIENFVHLAPHASLCGDCRIGDLVMIPTGTNIIPKWVISLQ